MHHNPQHLGLILVILGALIGVPVCTSIVLGWVQIRLRERPWWTGLGAVVRSVLVWPVVTLLAVATAFLAVLLLWPQGRHQRYEAPERMEGVDPP